MKQTFITLGEGLTDLFEFMTMIEYNHQRIDKIIYFHSPQSENKKFQMINDCAEKFDTPILGIDVQPPQAFHDLSLYYNYLISVLRLQKWIPELQ
ncbi:TPA: hypothetical protein SGT65_000681 [Staphylococcus aureus]|nr:hypothetical protein [Staphylococcus aureus]